jgi:hypothetical protein
MPEFALFVLTLVVKLISFPWLLIENSCVCNATYLLIFVKIVTTSGQIVGVLQTKDFSCREEIVPKINASITLVVGDKGRPILSIHAVLRLRIGQFRILLLGESEILYLGRAYKKC